VVVAALIQLLQVLLLGGLEAVAQAHRTTAVQAQQVLPTLVVAVVAVVMVTAALAAPVSSS
jgi:hypothetical protein